MPCRNGSVSESWLPRCIAMDVSVSRGWPAITAAAAGTWSTGTPNLIPLLPVEM